MARSVTVIPAVKRVGNNVKKYEKPKLRVAAYCRVSTDSDEQETSYEAQVEHYTTFIQKNLEWECAGIYADDGISGTNTKKREDFNRMIEDCKAGKIDMVITKSISRFARNTLDCLKYIRELKEKNIPVFFEKENINTMDSKGEVLLTIMASLAQQESQSLSQNVKLGFQFRYANGSHCEVEISKEEVWDAKHIYDRGMHLLGFMEERWNFKFENIQQKEELLHVGFVNDGREVPEEIVPESDAVVQHIDTNVDIGETRFEWREAYWTQALPAIKDAPGGDGPYSNVSPAKSSYVDGFFGIRGIHLCCSINLRPKRCLAGLWIDTGEVESSKKMYDLIFAHKAEIEEKMSMPITWRRKDDKRSCSIDIELLDVDYTDQDQWADLMAFHCKMSRELADYIVYAYEDEIRSVLN